MFLHNRAFGHESTPKESQKPPIDIPFGPNHTVIAGLRDPDSTSSKDLENLPHGKDSRVILIKIDSSYPTYAISAVETLKSEHNITKLDIVIANAGIPKYFGKAIETPAQEMIDHFSINTIAPLLLFQATAPLLNAAPAPKFVVLSSGAGSISGVDKLNVENTAYALRRRRLTSSRGGFITRIRN